MGVALIQLLRELLLSTGYNGSGHVRRDRYDELATGNRLLEAQISLA
jgi:hypothetical protein